MTRLSAERLDELFRGTLRLVAEHGFERITMDQVAEATSSSKATLYRQWGSKSTLVVEALRHLADSDEPPPDTGSLRGDLAALVTGRSTRIEAEADLIGAVLHAVKSDADLREACRERVLSAMSERLAVVVERAVGRGEVAADAPALRFADLVLIAPFVLRSVLEDEHVEDDYLLGYLDAVLVPALTRTPPGTTAATTA